MYTLFPRVVPADKEVTLTLLDESGGKFCGKATITIQSMEQYNVPHTSLYRIDEQDRYKPFETDVADGVAKFRYTFVGEQRHRIRCVVDNEECAFEVYSLQPDLYKLNPYKGDTHIHSTASDGLFTPSEVAELYYEAGFDYIALTDHHVYEQSAKLSQKISAVMSDYVVYPGEEVHNRGMGYFHIINFGAGQSVNEIINADPDGLFARVAETANQLAEKYNLPPQLDKCEFAFRYWVAQKIREYGGLSVLCHPYWDAYGEYNMSTDMLEFLLKNGIFDAFEVCDDDDHTGNGVNLQTAMYNQLRAEGYAVPIVGASDCHNLNSELFGKFFTYVFCDNVANVKQGIAQLNSVAVERIGNEYRVYGPFRLVKYARFITDQFEPYITELKKRYSRQLFIAVNEGDKQTASAIESRVAESRKRFFGRTND